MRRIYNLRVVKGGLFEGHTPAGTLRSEPWEVHKEHVPGMRESKCKGPGVGLTMSH